MASAPAPESSSFIEDVIECLQDTVSIEDLQQLLTQDEAWDIVATEAKLSREEADALREALKEHTADMATGDKDRLREVQQAKERFLCAFPKLKEETEEDIGKLRALADQIEQVHRDCTIANVVAGSTTAASVVLDILGWALAPFTAGLSGLLSGAGTVLGVASGMTSVSTSIVNYSSTSSVEGEARSLVSNSMDKLIRFIQAIGHFPPEVISSTENWSQFLKNIGKTIGAIQQAEGDRDLIVNAKYNMMIMNILVQGGVQVGMAFRHSALTMARAAKIFRAVTKVFSFVTDMVNLAQNPKNLHNGGKSEYAEQLQQLAQELERNLEDLKEIHKKWVSDSNQ